MYIFITIFRHLMILLWGRVLLLPPFYRWETEAQEIFPTTGKDRQSKVLDQSLLSYKVVSKLLLPLFFFFFVEVNIFEFIAIRALMEHCHPWSLHPLPCNRDRYYPFFLKIGNTQKGPRVTVGVAVITALPTPQPWLFFNPSLEIKQNPVPCVLFLWLPSRKVSFEEDAS